MTSSDAPGVGGVTSTTLVCTSMFDPDDLDPVTASYHEAGHALVAHLLGGRVVEVTLEDDSGDLHGKTTVTWRTVAAAEQARRSGLTALGGPLAETRHRGEVDPPEAFSAWAADWRDVQRALAVCSRPDAARMLLQRWVAEVAAWYADADVWERLCRVADALEAHGTLDADLFAAAIAD